MYMCACVCVVLLLRKTSLFYVWLYGSSPGYYIITGIKLLTLAEKESY